MLPIKKVLLYKHGVGYFEREGTVQGDVAIDLTFKSGEMNDVLKSLTVLDMSGGLISSISYESTKPVEKQLEDIAIRMGEDQALRELLSQVKGARIKIVVGSEEIDGKISCIETIRRQKGDAVTESFLLTVLINDMTLRSFDLLEIKSLTFLDQGLRQDLNHLLEVLISSKKKDAKKLTIYARGTGERNLLAAYVVETPVWKVSYRVLLSDEKPVIQGWALVDNTQDEDGKEVSLTLVAGLPISFVHDLYSPRYKKRPVVEVEEEEAYAPPVLEQAFGEAVPIEIADHDDIGGMMMFKRDFADTPMPATRSRSEARRKSAPVQTRTVEVGDLFQYEITNPVTVKRNQSALVPILQNEFNGERCAVYNQEIRDKNPMSALLIRNDTGLTLEGGPITVMEDETYAGEAMLDTLKPQGERIVPYSVELGCTVTTDHKSHQEKVHRVRIGKGYLYADYFQIKNHKYLINNKTGQKLDLFLEHRFSRGWDLVDTPKPYETTDNFYRFRMEVPPGQTISFPVREKHLEYNSYHLKSINAGNIAYWVEQGYIDGQIRRKLDELLKYFQQISQLDRELSELDDEMEEISQDQERLRENLKALGDSTDEKRLRERYVNDLSRQEDQMNTLRKKIKDLKNRREKVEETLQKEMSRLEMDKKLQ